MAALADLVDLTPVGLVADATDGAWVMAPHASSLKLWASVAHQAFRQPMAVGRGLAGLAWPAVRRPRDAAAGIRAGLAACAVADSLDVDLIHAQFAGPAAAGANALHHLTGIPYTVRAHAYDIYRPYSWAGRVLADSAAIVSISRHGDAHIAHRWKLPSRLIRVGVPVDTIPEREDQPPRDPMRFLAVGALAPKKGHDLLIAAVHRVNRSTTRVRLDIYGDGPLRSELKARADPEAVRFRGSIDPGELRRRYGTYDAFALAARVAADGDMDGIPVVLMEAGLSGLPIVTTRVAGIPELIEDGVTGFTCEPTVDALAAAIESVLADYDGARARAAAARDRVKQLHDLRRTTADLVRLWEEVVAASRQPLPLDVDR